MMSWTKEKPMAPGYYWEYDSEIDDIEMIKVGFFYDELWDLSPINRGQFPHKIKDKDDEYYWFGPIIPPCAPA
jgi:hypothetical protein